MTADVDPAGTDAPPTIVVRIVSGDPTEEELAATQAVIAAVLAEQAALGAPRKVAAVDLWRRAARAPRAVVQAGPGAWSASRGQRGC
ncbi:MAG: acyl-CoA carboxylase subunit epsilon [Actinomycetes bacterium]